MLRERLSKIVWGQFRKPNGIIGQLIGDKMARENVLDASWTVSLLEIQPEHRVLDIGFGPGVSTQLASVKAHQGVVVGIDHSGTMVQAARKRNANLIKDGRIEVKQGDVSSIPYPDEFFDRVFSIHSIYFWAQPVDGIRELRRVLKTGGFLAITIQPKEKWTEAQKIENDIYTLFSSEDLVSIFTAAELRNLRVEVFPEQDSSPRECVLGVK